MKIVVLEAGVMTPGGLSLDVYKKFGEVTYYHTTKQEQVIERIGDADIILLNKLIIDKEVMTACKNLKFIGLFATGFNTIDVKTAREMGITVCNAGAYSTNAVAQHTFALILNHFNRIADYKNAVDGGVWEKSELTTLYDFPTDELFGKTIGIVGYGNIGKVLSKMLISLNADVTVSARKEADFLFAKSENIKCINTNDIKSINEYDIVFNTVPFLLFNKEWMYLYAENCLFGIRFSFKKQELSHF